MIILKKILTSFHLKIIALFSMSLDHIGSILFPDCLFLRLLGRISLPIFVFLLIEGYFHTSSKGKYFLRMLVFAFISEPFYDFAFYDTFFYSKNQNILFLLALGILFLFLLEQVSKIGRAHV